MARTPIRTATLSLDIKSQLENLFGTVANAYRCLGLHDMPYHNFYRAMQFQTITPQQRELIEDRWARWRELFLRPDVPESEALELTPFNLDLDPEWYQDGLDVSRN